MQQLFNFDIKNYDPKWTVSSRPSARGIIRFENNRIALVYSKKFDYYKFPGGGIHDDEDKIVAMIREVQEETGLVVRPETVEEFGYVGRLQKSNYLPETIFQQDNFYYTCSVESEVTVQNLDDYEKDEEFELRIVDIQQAIETNNRHSSEDSYRLIMVMREAAVLQMLLGKTPEPSPAFAEFLLETGAAKNPGPWREHSYAVAKAAKKMAEAINQNGGNMNPVSAYVYGLLHDIGRQEGFTYMAHVWDGYEFMAALGYKNVAQICLTHSFNLQKITDYIGKQDVTEEQYQKMSQLLSEVTYTDYDRLIQLLDSTCSADGSQNMEERMNDVKRRYGDYPQAKWDKNFELKAYFEKLMGRDFYEVIK